MLIDALRNGNNNIVNSLTPLPANDLADEEEAVLPDIQQASLPISNVPKTLSGLKVHTFVVDAFVKDWYKVIWHRKKNQIRCDAKTTMVFTISFFSRFLTEPLPPFPSDAHEQ